MNKIAMIVSGCLLLWSPGLRAGADVQASKSVTVKKDVSIYEVPWRCPAAPQIGCGSHAKPILLQLEQAPGVREAWLNRQGTMVAVVWKPDVTGKERRDVRKTLKEQGAAKPSGKARANELLDFESGKGWYRGAEVDRLSEQEAGVIATKWVRRVQEKTTVIEEKAEGLRGALTEALKKRLTRKAAMPETQEGKAAELRRVASPFLEEKQLQILTEAAACGMRALPDEK